MLRKHLRVRVDVNGDAFGFPVQVEGELIFGRWEVNHEESFDGNFDLSSGSAGYGDKSLVEVKCEHILKLFRAFLTNWSRRLMSVLKI